MRHTRTPTQLKHSSVQREKAGGQVMLMKRGAFTCQNASSEEGVSQADAAARPPSLGQGGAKEFYAFYWK